MKLMEGGQIDIAGHKVPVPVVLGVVAAGGLFLVLRQRKSVGVGAAGQGLAGGYAPDLSGALDRIGEAVNQEGQRTQSAITALQTGLLGFTGSGPGGSGGVTPAGGTGPGTPPGGGGGGGQPGGGGGGGGTPPGGGGGGTPPATVTVVAGGIGNAPAFDLDHPSAPTVYRPPEAIWERIMGAGRPPDLGSIDPGAQPGFAPISRAQSPARLKQPAGN